MWPSCEECQRDCCYTCAEPRTLKGEDGRPERVLCKQCAFDLMVSA